jgi:hypothetical protein
MFLHLQNGGGFLLGRLCEASVHEKALTPTHVTSFLYFENMDSGPVAEFMPSDMSTTFILAAFAAGDINADGIKDFAILESTDTDLMEGKADPTLQIRTYNYLRVFFGREAGGFSGQIGVDEADMTIVVEGLADIQTVYSAWILDLSMTGFSDISGYYYPAVAPGDFNGDGYGDLAYTTYFSEYGRTAVGVVFGSDAGDIKEGPDVMIVGSSTPATGYPETLWQVAAGDIDGDGYDDVITSNTFEVEVDVKADKAGGVIPQSINGSVLAFLGRSQWPSTVSTSTADVVITEEVAQDELGRLTPFTLLAEDLDRDGYADIAATAPRALYDSIEQIASGIAYVFNGRAGLGSADADKEILASDADHIMLPAEGVIYLGTLGWLPGDLDNNGLPELMVLAMDMGTGEIRIPMYELGPEAGSMLVESDAVSIPVISGVVR